MAKTLFVGRAIQCCKDGARRLQQDERHEYAEGTHIPVVIICDVPGRVIFLGGVKFCPWCGFEFKVQSTALLRAEKTG